MIIQKISYTGELDFIQNIPKLAEITLIVFTNLEPDKLI